MSTIQFLPLDMVEFKAIIHEAIKTAILESENFKPYLEPEDQIYTPDEAAEVLKTCKSTVSNWRKEGVLNSWAIGGRVYIKRSDIDNAMIRIKSKNNKS